MRLAATGYVVVAAAATVLLLLSKPAADSAARQRLPDGFASLLTGNALDAWHISRSSSHGSTREWDLDNGILSGAQRPAGNGGVLLTNWRYGDVEVYLELWPDFGCDGGLFLRSNEQGDAYQVMIDYLPGGNIGGVYGEGLNDVAGTSSDEWRKHWKPDAWNTLRARIENAVPHIQVWLNGHRVTDWRDTANHASGGATTGMIGLQVHGGGRWTPGGVHRFRAIAAKELRQGSP